MSVQAMAMTTMRMRVETWYAHVTAVRSMTGRNKRMSDYKEIIAKEYHNEKGLLTRREIGEEIVRCKDCIHNSYSPDNGNACCDLFYGMTDQMGFCHHGERRKA